MADRSKITREEQAVRQEFWRLAESLTPYVAVEHEHAIFLVPTRTDNRFFRKPNRKDFVILGRAASILADRGRPVEGTTFVDVGAHLGTTTVTALTDCGFAHAVAVEPDPTNVRVLHGTIGLNGLTARATVVPAAIASSAGTARFALAGPTGDRGTSSAKGRLTADRSETTIEVPTVTLDGLAEDGLVDPASTGLLWLDCQKQELEALAGGSRFLQARVPVVFALRASALTSSDPLLATLAGAYSSFVNMRPTKERARWKPRFQPVEELASFAGERKTLTDVLLVP